MLYIISICIILLGLYKRKSNIVYIAMLFWMWILFAFNYNNADYTMYQQFYNSDPLSTMKNTEILFKIFCEIAVKIGLEYKAFIMIYSILPIILIGKSIKKYTNNATFVLSCYFAFPFLVDIVQIRHFMAIAIVTYAFQFLLTNNKKDIVKYILLNIVAVGFHTSSIIYLLFVLIKKINSKKVKIGVIACIIILIIVIQTNLLPNILEKFVPTNKVETYFISNKWRPELKISIRYMIIQTSITAFMLIIYNYWRKHSLNMNKDEEWNKRNNIITYVYKINIILMIILPLYLYSTQLVRIIRGILLLNYIAVGNVLEKKCIKDNIIIEIITLLMVTFLYYMLIIKPEIFESTIDSIMNYNYLFMKG